MSEETAYNQAIRMMHVVRTELDRAIECMMIGKNIEGGIHLETARHRARDYEIELHDRKRGAFSDEEEVVQ